MGLSSLGCEDCHWMNYRWRYIWFIKQIHQNLAQGHCSLCPVHVTPLSPHQFPCPVITSLVAGAQWACTPLLPAGLVPCHHTRASALCSSGMVQEIRVQRVWPACGVRHPGYLDWYSGAGRLKEGQLSGPRLNIKTVLSTYGNFHVKDKTAVRTSYL